MEVVVLTKNETNMDDLIFTSEENTTGVLVLEKETNLDELIDGEERKDNVFYLKSFFYISRSDHLLFFCELS